MEIPFNKPTLPSYALLSSEVEAFYASGMITNGPIVRRLEAEIQNAFSVGDAVAISCCTCGLMLALRCKGLSGKVALPSFTFFASAHAVRWNGLEPVFVDVEPDTWNLSPGALELALEEDEDICAVLPVNIFGNPCDVGEIGKITRNYGLSLIYDSAHAMGSIARGDCIGSFGDAEVFSLSPTKLVVAGEGGVITTTDAELAERLRAGRDYGNTGDYNPSFIGLNARMSEFHAALAIESFRMLEQNVTRRNEIARRYVEGLSRLPGITFQVIKKGNRSTFKDFTILVDEEEFGLDRAALSWYLGRNGMDSRKYYDPPVHRTKAYWEKWGRQYDEYLPVTNRLSAQVLSLPIWSHMELYMVDRVVEAVSSAHDRAEEIGHEYIEASR